MKEKKRRAGMYGETPSVKIGNVTICRQDPDGTNDSVWMELIDGEGTEVKDSRIGPDIEALFNKYM